MVYYRDTEGAIRNAMAKVRNKELSVDKASEEYGIPSSTLRRHLKLEKGPRLLGRASVQRQEHKKRIVAHIKELKKEKESTDDDWFNALVPQNKKLIGLLGCAQRMNLGIQQQTLIVDNDVNDLIDKSESAEANSVSSVSSQSAVSSGIGISYSAVNYGIHDYAKEKNGIIVDLRSDTLTKPTAAMKKAMFEAEVGDDVFEEDPTVKELQKKAAELLGKEDALFVSSGTMENLIADMNHCNVRGSEVYCGSQSHVFIHEQSGAAQIAGASICTLPNNDDGTFDLNVLESAILNHGSRSWQ